MHTIIFQFSIFKLRMKIIFETKIFSILKLISFLCFSIQILEFYNKFFILCLIESLFKFFISAVHLFCISLCIQVSNSISMTQFPVYSFLGGFVLSLAGSVESLEVTLGSNLFSHSGMSVKNSAWSNTQKTKSLVKDRKQRWLFGRFPQPYRVRLLFLYHLHLCWLMVLLFLPAISHFILRKPSLPSWCG